MGHHPQRIIGCLISQLPLVKPVFPRRLGRACLARSRDAHNDERTIISFWWVTGFQRERMSVSNGAEDRDRF
jgi:hypothetical protein